MRILIATSNRHKIAEIRGILAGLPVGLANPRDEGLDGAPPEETGADFAANALIKAQVYGASFGGPVLADDSGLVVPALGGEPGLYSARYAGPDADDAANRRRLLERLRETGLARPEAYFICCACLLVPGRAPRFFEGRWEGHILPAERGLGGFGYDPLFLPLGSTLSAAEMEADRKNRESHRARAFLLLRAWLEQEAGGTAKSPVSGLV